MRRRSSVMEKMKYHFSCTSTAAQAQPAQMFVVASTKNELGGLRSLLVSSINQHHEKQRQHNSNKPGAIYFGGGIKGPMQVNKVGDDFKNKSD